MVVGIAMVKDEADIIGATVEHMLQQVDFVIVADNGSTDGTWQALSMIAIDSETNHRLTVVDDPDPAYYQSQKMTALAVKAAEAGADWVIPFDADERWYSPFGRIADVLGEHPGASIVKAELYDHVATAADPSSVDPAASIGWRRRNPAPLPKVAVRPLPRATIHQGNHGADYGQTIDGLLVVRHYPYRSVEQMISKARNGAAAYAATDLPEDVGAHWRGYGKLTDQQIGDVFRQYFWSASPETDPGLIYDPAP